MGFRRYVAPTAREALERIRKELGADAVILSNRRTAVNRVEIIAAAQGQMDALVDDFVPAAAAAPALPAARKVSRAPGAQAPAVVAARRTPPETFQEFIRRQSPEPGPRDEGVAMYHEIAAGSEDLPGPAVPRPSPVPAQRGSLAERAARAALAQESEPAVFRRRPSRGAPVPPQPAAALAEPREPQAVAPPDARRMAQQMAEQMVPHMVPAMVQQMVQRLVAEQVEQMRPQALVQQPGPAAAPAAGLTPTTPVAAPAMPAAMPAAMPVAPPTASAPPPQTAGSAVDAPAAPQWAQPMPPPAFAPPQVPMPSASVPDLPPAPPLAAMAPPVAPASPAAPPPQAALLPVPAAVPPAVVAAEPAHEVMFAQGVASAAALPDSRLLAELQSLRSALTDRISKLEDRLADAEPRIPVPPVPAVAMTLAAPAAPAAPVPVRRQVMTRLIMSGFSPQLARRVGDAAPATLEAKGTDAWLQQVIGQYVRCPADVDNPLQNPGAVALVGPTGVGKTTTIAKIAARFVVRHGAGALGLVTLDSYRMGAHEQLRGYGRILGVPVHTAHDVASLRELLASLQGRRQVLIDTCGMSQRDPRLGEMLDMLDQVRFGDRPVKRVLLVNAASHAETLDEVARGWRVEAANGAILTKIDEAARIGGALDALMRFQTPLLGLTNGQRVPEDWHPGNPPLLAHIALKPFGAAFSLDSEELQSISRTGALIG
jgi:flagellar biosynthesis protein FlhF